MDEPIATPTPKPKYRITWKPHSADSFGAVEIRKHNTLITRLSMARDDTQELAADLRAEYVEE